MLCCDCTGQTLRLIKYAVGKCGVEFRREMQRHSVAIRQLLHYKGQSDPVKGDAFNKAMRDTAQEAISAIFSADDTNKQPLPRNQSGVPWSQDASVTRIEMSNGKTGASYAESKPQEDRLLETVASSGGVRLQPTRDAIQVFLREAAKLDAMALCHAIERKLQSPMWQACLLC